MEKAGKPAVAICTEPFIPTGRAIAKIRGIEDYPFSVVRNPVGMDGVFEGYCPPYFANMDAAVDSIIAGTRGGLGEFLDRGGQVPHTISNEQYESGIPDTSPEGEACAKSVCNYIYDTYGKFPGTVDTMHLMWFMQVHHLDLDFYDKFFKPGAYSQTHRDHLATWHPD